MNRFEYLPAQFREDESFVSKDKSVKLFDGDEKVYTHLEFNPQSNRKNKFSIFFLDII